MDSESWLAELVENLCAAMEFTQGNTALKVLPRHSRPSSCFFVDARVGVLLGGGLTRPPLFVYLDSVS